MSSSETALVTICIPTYQSESTLAETLKSLVTQTYSNIKIKIFDNGSTDRTVQIARDFTLQDKRVSLNAFEKNIGAEGNFTRCLQAAEGDYTIICHADDVYESTMISEQVAFLNSRPQCSAVATHAGVIDAEGRSRGHRFLPKELSERAANGLDFENLLKLTLRYGNFITCPSVMARSAIYRDTIRTWNAADFRTSADLDVWLRLAKVGPIGFLTKPLIRYRVSTSSFTVRETKQRTTEHDLFLVLRHYAQGRSQERDALLLSQKDMRFLRFLEFKDTALRRWNVLKSSQPDLTLPRWTEHPIQSWLSLTTLAFSTAYHLKFFLVATGIFVLSWAMRLVGLAK